MDLNIKICLNDSLELQKIYIGNFLYYNGEFFEDCYGYVNVSFEILPEHIKEKFEKFFKFWRLK